MLTFTEFDDEIKYVAHLCDGFCRIVEIILQQYRVAKCCNIVTLTRVTSWRAYLYCDDINICRVNVHRAFGISSFKTRQ